MLHTLSIRDIVLIDKLDLMFEDGLCVLTGETGAGKSILLDALSLALGARADGALLRKGVAQASVTAQFEIDSGHPVFVQLQDHGIDADGDTLILRRTLSADGKSRAFVNDQPVSAGFLRALGGALVEVHGQHDDRGLLNTAGHRALLDAYGGHEYLCDAASESYRALSDAHAALAEEARRLQTMAQEEEYDRHCLEELRTLAIEDGEEARLADERSLMMQGEQASGDLNDVLEMLSADGGIDAQLRGSLRRLERIAQRLQGHLDYTIEALGRAALEAEEGIVALTRLKGSLDFNPDRLDQVEERLFALRAQARKHKCTVDDLPLVRQELEKRLGALAAGEGRVKALQEQVSERKARFQKATRSLSAARGKAAGALAKGVSAELPHLKLEKARFEVGLNPIAVDDWGESGGERVEFMIATNAGSDLGPLMKIASGGELSRIILALKVVLAQTGKAPTLIFDEVDRGIGGATADAVGERLARLSRDAQVLVVTHSPQVAARGSAHWRITKLEDLSATDDAKTFTRVVPLGDGERREEIARMLSGASVTEEARAAADRLLKAG